jgi:serine protease
MESSPRSWLHGHRRLCLAAASAVAVTAAMTTASSLPALAASQTAPAPACSTTKVVHLQGKTFHVQVNGRFGVVAQRGHQMAANEPAKSACRTRLAAGDALQNGGGPVASNGTVYLDFWGSQWDSDSNGVEQYMESLFSGLGTGSDSWSTIMSQYGASVADPVLAGVWVDDAGAAPASSSQADLAAEAQNAAGHFGVSGPDVDIFVVSPSGTSPDGFPNTGFCAWHDWNGTSAYTNMPYVLDAGSSCGADSVQNQLDGFSIVGGHEYAEAVTDPEPPSGWVDPSGEEIGDLCAWQDLQAINLGTGAFAMQPLWSNAAGGCVQSG